MKFEQLEYNMGKIFMKKYYWKCVGETSPRLFSEKSKLSISLDQNFDTVCFYCISLFRTARIYWNKSIDQFLLPHISTKTKRSLELVFLPRFLKDFFLKKQNFVIWLPLLLEILYNICIVVISFPVHDAINAEINLF